VSFSKALSRLLAALAWSATLVQAFEKLIREKHAVSHFFEAFSLNPQVASAQALFFEKCIAELKLGGTLADF